MRGSLNFCSDQPFYPISDHKANKLESDNYKSTSHPNDHATQQMGVDVLPDMENMPVFESKGKVYDSWQADQQRIKNDHSTNKHGGAEHEAADQLLHKAQVVTLHSSTHTKAAGCEDHDQAGNVQVAAAGLISMRAGLRTCIFPQPPVGDLHLVAMEAATAVQMQASMPALVTLGDNVGNADTCSDMPSSEPKKKEEMRVPKAAKKCVDCGTTATPKWRRSRTVCNACGMQEIHKRKALQGHTQLVAYVKSALAAGSAAVQAAATATTARVNAVESAREAAIAGCKAVETCNDANAPTPLQSARPTPSPLMPSSASWQRSSGTQPSSSAVSTKTHACIIGTHHIVQLATPLQTLTMGALPIQPVPVQAASMLPCAMATPTMPHTALLHSFPLPPVAMMMQMRRPQWTRTAPLQSMRLHWTPPQVWT